MTRGNCPAHAAWGIIGTKCNPEGQNASIDGCGLRFTDKYLSDHRPASNQIFQDFPGTPIMAEG